ncbi:hypothetical protein CASFOL_033687 [Castilleja foliolosa]|uniref:Uncharacterized protein n=1 Tax=Castilleja foliolosa TaxID=1961234 RepID=A0ABD3BYU3_9LAMI
MSVNFLCFVEEGVPISIEGGKSLLCGVWLNPGFVHPLAATIGYNTDMIDSVMANSNQESVADRIAHMEADPYFKPAMLLFLSILIGHWGDGGLLRVLDQIMGKSVFGRRLDMFAKMKAAAIERTGKKLEVERFSFVIEDISHVKDMEPLRQLLVERYGPREDINVKAILKDMFTTYRLHWTCRDKLPVNDKDWKDTAQDFNP